MAFDALDAIPVVGSKIKGGFACWRKKAILWGVTPLFSVPLPAAAMNPLELSESPKAATVAAGTTRPQNQALPKVRELGQLIADIRRARAVLDAAGLTDEPVRLEHVISNDPRD
jgi:hypothetical protein